MFDERQWIILAALRAECDAVKKALSCAQNSAIRSTPDDVARSTSSVLRCGVGPKNSGRTASRALSEVRGPATLCSTGFCGALIGGLNVGDIVIADAVSDGQTKIDVTGRVHEGICRALMQAKIP